MIIRSRPAGNSGVFVCVFVFVPYPDTIRACVRITLPSTLIQFVCLCVCFSVFSLVEYPDTIAIDGLPGCYCQERCDEMDCDGQTIITLTDVNEIPQNGSAPMLTTLSDCGADFREFLSGGAGPLHLHMRLATMGNTDDDDGCSSDCQTVWAPWTCTTVACRQTTCTMDP